MSEKRRHLYPVTGASLFSR